MAKCLAETVLQFAFKHYIEHGEQFIEPLQCKKKERASEALGNANIIYKNNVYKSVALTNCFIIAPTT